MKKRVHGDKKFEQAEGQISLSTCLAFFLFLAESARHFYNTTVQFAPVAGISATELWRIKFSQQLAYRKLRDHLKRGGRHA